MLLVQHELGIHNLFLSSVVVIATSKMMWMNVVLLLSVIAEYSGMIYFVCGLQSFFRERCSTVAFIYEIYSAIDFYFTDCWEE